MSSIKFSSLPADVRSDVDYAVRQLVRDEATSRMRYHKQNGFESPWGYRDHLIKTIKPCAETVKYCLIEVMRERYVSGGYTVEPWMNVIPNAKYICDKALMARVG